MLGTHAPVVEICGAFFVRVCLVLVGALVGAVFDGGRAFPMVGSCVVWAWSGGWTTDVMLC